ncbi:MFS transporter [Streptomyces sp. NPDC050418]|uniref:MFS transporter n=1 Tax=Streptomyces sp. NPDC050418 TaxID=3365612 RepID=UPI0037A7E74E
MTRPLLIRFVSIIGASVSYYLLLSVVPLYTEASGYAGAVGLTTGALMFATVGGVLVTPRVVRRYGTRGPLAVGLVLMGAPAVVLTVSGHIAWIVAVCLVRGVGFALTLVAGSALTMALVPPERRGEGLALAGLMSGVPTLAALPLGVWLAAHGGYGPVAVAAGLTALAALLSVPALPRQQPAQGKQVGLAAGFREGELVRPTAVFGATAVAAGVVVTFLPLAVPAGAAGLAAAALFLQPATATAARWFAGRHGDRHGPVRLVLPGLLLSALGTLLLALPHVPAAVLAGAALFGTGFGICQNSTLSLMYSRVRKGSYATVTAMWNFAFDAGTGIGAVGFGLAAGPLGYPLSFACTAALMLVAVLPALRDRRVPASF